MRKVQILCRFSSKSFGKSRFHARCIFPHKLEQRMKVFARACEENTPNSIKSRKYSSAASKDKVFHLTAWKFIEN